MERATRLSFLIDRENFSNPSDGVRLLKYLVVSVPPPPFLNFA
jgi:hypothetical protein